MEWFFLFYLSICLLFNFWGVFFSNVLLVRQYVLYSYDCQTAFCSCPAFLNLFSWILWMVFGRWRMIIPLVLTLWNVLLHKCKISQMILGCYAVVREDYVCVMGWYFMSLWISLIVHSKGWHHIVSGCVDQSMLLWIMCWWSQRSNGRWPPDPEQNKQV